MAVNGVAAGYIEAQMLAVELAEAQGRVRVAWMLYEQALVRLGPFPQTAWGERKLAEREKAVGAALGCLRKAGERLACVGVGTLERGMGRSARLVHERKASLERVVVSPEAA